MNVYLRAFEPDDYILINCWRNDSKLWVHTGGNRYFVSSETERKWVQDKILQTDKDMYFAICLSEDDRMVGYLSLNNIDWRNRKGEWGGILVGDNKCRGKGVALAAVIQMLEIAFSELGLNRLSGYWLTSNQESIAIAERVGFRKEGELRDYVFKGNKFHNAFLMSLLKSEYEGSGK